LQGVGFAFARGGSRMLYLMSVTLVTAFLFAIGIIIVDRFYRNPPPPPTTGAFGFLNFNQSGERPDG
jgi:hypothetical protein